MLDIAVVVKGGHRLNLEQTAAFLQMKAQDRSVPVSKAAFRNPEIAERATLDYDAFAATTRTIFIPFDEALATVLALVEKLPIPDA